MPLYLLDANTISAVMGDHPKVKAKMAAVQPARIVTCVIVRGEIRYGLEKLPTGKRRANLESKAAAAFAALPIEPIDPTAGEIYATIRRSLELKGRTIRDNDLWIAAATLSLGATLVSNDQGFTYVPGLKVEDWMT
jgi:tRNA(fMet)-specific endonuclease VapC